MKIATLTIDRGDRPRMVEQCKRLIKRQTLKPDLEIYVIEPSKSSAIDIVPRFRSGWEEAKKHNIDIIVVIESDDWYRQDYLMRNISLFNNISTTAIGCNSSLYYNVCNQTWQLHSHPGRCSLYTTMFLTDSLNNFRWPKDDYRFLDIPLWKHFLSNTTMLSDDNLAVGIKHNEGIGAGIGHRARMPNQDKNFKYLESIVKEDIDFYKTFCNG